MRDDEKDLIDKDEFNAKVQRWSSQVQLTAKSNLQIKTHGDGDLEDSVSSDLGDTQKYAVNRIAFSFKRYGVFVHYGVGNGYIRQGGMVVRGYRVMQGTKVRKKMTPLYRTLWKKGYSRKEISKYKVIVRETFSKRIPLDWFDSVVERSISGLADLTGEYYGDRALRSVIEKKNKIKISKS